MAFRFDHGRKDDLDLEEVHEINVTPFIDVILVLLIIFMVAAPLSTVDVAVELPATNAAAAPRPDKPVFLTITTDRSLTIGETTVARSDLTKTLLTATGSDKAQRIYLRADRSVPYGELMDVMNDLRTAGFLKVGLVALEKPPGP